MFLCKKYFFTKNEPSWMQKGWELTENEQYFLYFAGSTLSQKPEEFQCCSFISKLFLVTKWHGLPKELKFKCYLKIIGYNSTFDNYFFVLVVFVQYTLKLQNCQNRASTNSQIWQILNWNCHSYFFSPNFFIFIAQNEDLAVT